MTEPAETDATMQRLQALQAARAASAGAPPAPAPATARPASSSTTSGRPAASKQRSGPAPARIIAAAASVSAGIGLVALMAGAQQDIVVQVNPAPVMVQPASVIVEIPGDGQEPQIRIVEAAVPVERPAPQAKVVSQSEGS